MNKLAFSFLYRLAQIYILLIRRLGGVDKSVSGHALIALFKLKTLVDHAISRVCVTHYEGRHPKHHMWSEHNRYLFDSINNGDAVLDIGCGASVYPSWLAEKASSVTCVDIRPDRVEAARRMNTTPNVHYEVMDVTRDLPAGRFDVAVLSHVLEHLDDPVDFLRILAEKTPRLVIKVPLVDTDWMKLVQKDLGMFWMDDPDHRREYTPDLLRRQLEEAGWRVTELIRGYDLRATADSLGIAHPAIREHA